VAAAEGAPAQAGGQQRAAAGPLTRPRPHPPHAHTRTRCAAGPLWLARAHLDDGSGEPFFVFNSDVTCDYPLKELLDFQRSHAGSEGTLLITRVVDFTKYGVVAHDEAGLVSAFVEKPSKDTWGNHINAGLYCLSPSILARIPANTPCSIEKEVFPFAAEEKRLFCLRIKKEDQGGYWMDIGQPKDYVAGVHLHLRHVRATAPAELAPPRAGIRGNVLIHPTATVAETAVLGPDVVVGPGCRVEEGARLLHSTLLEGSVVKAHAYVDMSIVGWKSTVGQWGRVEGSTVLGEDVQVGEGVLVNGALVLPHKSVRESIFAKGSIIM